MKEEFESEVMAFSDCSEDCQDCEYETKSIETKAEDILSMIRAKANQAPAPAAPEPPPEPQDILSKIRNRARQQEQANNILADIRRRQG